MAASHGTISRGRIGPVTVPQLVVLQVTALAVAAAYPLSDWVFVPTVLAAAGVAAAGLGRHTGRWWYQDAARRWSLLRRRRRAARSSTRPDPLLAALAPSLSVGAVTEVTARQLRFGLGLDRAGWFLAGAVWPAGDDPARRLSLERLVTGLAASRPPISALRVVHHTPGTQHPLAPEQVWVALRLGIADAPEVAASRGGGVDGVHRTLAAAAALVGKVVRAAGLEHRVLDHDELIAAMVTVAGWDLGGASGAPPVERWSAWYGTGAAHVCFRLGGTEPRRLDDLIAGLPHTSALASTVCAPVPLSGTGAPPQLLQVAAAPDRLAATTSEVTQLAGQLGITVRRLDGEHGPALYATAPTGAATRS